MMIWGNIAIIAPASRLDSEKFDSGIGWLKRHGAQVTVMPNVLGGAEEKYLSASAEARVADLHSAWGNPETDLIICTRGGFGSAQILSLIDWALLRSRDIPLLGLSDITALHLAMFKNGVGTPVSGPMLGRLAEMDDFTGDSLKRAISGAEPQKIIATPLQHGANFEAFPRALNLTIAASLCGTPFMPDLSGTLLILEDIAEPPYKIERALTQLQQCGILGQCAGLAFGQFTDCGTEAELEHIFRKYASEVKGPVWSGFPFGHEAVTVSLNWARLVRVENMAIFA